MIKVIGGTKQQKEIATKVVEWFLKYFHRLLANNVNIYVTLRPYVDCWGYCVEGSTEHSYRIMVVHEQSVRDFVATLVHEMVHVMQWETKEWTDDGEGECERMQYMLADQLWNEGTI